MQKSRLAWFVSVVLLASAPADAEPSPAIPAGEDYGAGLTLSRPTSLAEVVLDPERFEQQPILLRGRISDVCQRKGCWTILRDGSAHVRVRFKDYAFFLPRDATGAEAFIEGFVKVETLSEKEARHYESESRDGDPESVDGPRREVGFTASGVRLLGRD
jgi:hypothetical protein